MRNITLSNFESYSVDGLRNCDAFYTDRGYVLLYSEGRIIKLEENDETCTSVEICNLTDDLYPIGDCQEIPKAVDIIYSFEKNSVFLLLYNGDIISVEHQQNMCSSDIVGTVDGGLKAAKWSPEKEVLALVTGTDTVIVMTNSFDPVSEVNLHGGGFGEKQFTAVGWGKKETQFRGSEGKYKAQSNVQSSLKSDTAVDNSVRISWRGDAELFAVSCVSPETSERYLRIFSKEGVLQYTSEVIPGLEQALDWRPSGNLIASTQRLPNKHNVCFFEKNGLKHGEFTLPFKQNEVIVKELKWSEDSKFLAVLTEKIVESENQESAPETNEADAGEKSILIYCVNNYHWYCKYRIPFTNDTEIMMKWDEQVSNVLHVILKKGNKIAHNKYKWIWTVNKSQGNSVGDKAFVAVIDGSKLLLTSFKAGILPPPMCSYSLEVPSQINQIGFAPGEGDSDTSSNDLFVQLCSGEIQLYKFEWNDGKPNQMTHRLVGQLNHTNNFIYNIHWFSPKTFAFCEKSNDPVSKSFFGVIDIESFDSSVKYNEKKYPLKSSIALLTSFSDSCILLHDNAGDTYLFDRNNEEFRKLYAEQKRWLIEMDVIQKKDKSFVVLGLDKSNRFFVNDKMIANNITSFHIHQEFLLLTNLKHRLLCVPIETEGEISVGAELNEVSTRRVERGSRIVTSVAKDTKVVLQMPRGNLECIQPRALSFSVIGKLLDELQYYKAFNIMRQQRINLNLLYDHNPGLFKESVNVFIEQIKDPNWISLFLSELVDEDVTKTMYSVIYKSKDVGSYQGEKSKVAVVCELLERALGRLKDADKYVLPILTTYIKRGETPYIECALSKIKKLKESENHGEKVAVTFDEAFRYLLYLIDVEDLYKVALGMYDFDLVLLVATKSQKDPKEYLPFLNDLRKLEVNYQKFMIDKHLKRYEKALKNLLQCGGDDFFTECLTFIKTHKLYKAALKLVPHTTDRYKQICANYAEELLTSHLYEEAGIMFSNSGSYSSAIAAFTKSGNWQEVISCSTKLKLTNQETNELYLNLAGELVEGKRYREASIVYMDYLKNTELALISLCLGKMFAEAFRIAELHRRDDLIQAHVKPGALECYRTTKTQIDSFGELFNSQKKRLAVVREKKLLQGREIGDGFDGGLDQDSFSESSTVVTQSHAGSRTTNRTFRSAKNRRKQERKLLSLKEGSPYEDLALIASLHNIVTNCLEMRTEVRELNKCLVKMNEEALAEELQKCLGKLLKEIEDSRSAIWTNDLLSGRQGYGPEATSNSIAAAFMQSEGAALTNLINPRLLIPPEVQTNGKWELEILKV